MNRQRGFSYLIMLFFVALTAAGLAALGQRWSMAAQREREAELEFRGGEIARAIASYVKASPHGAARHPRRLEDLLLDPRGPKPLHHLRRLYTDPFTGQADWVLLPEPAQADGFNGVHSRADRPLLRQVPAADGVPIGHAKEWLFLGRAYERPGAGAAVPLESAPVPLMPEPPPSPASSPRL